MPDHAHGVESSRTVSEATAGSNATTGTEATTNAEVTRETADTEATRETADTEATRGTADAEATRETAGDEIETRLRAVERAVTGGETRPADVAAGAEATAERERLGSRLDDLEARVAELESATQAIRGYAGAIRAVNREVERRADLALARATAAGRDDESEGPEPATGGEGAVPSESAIDAALPDDRPRTGPRTGGDGNDGDGDGGAWATDALDRLRESL
ncbi:hypothetical protein ABNG03_06935 [Halorubrum sp. RMP-47]|uniref:DUF7310 domain-containing protein n=1 Tax=Halorubrum miltondacostae TaxID=3076378 RepID=A0ABD5M1Y9_9EURY